MKTDTQKYIHVPVLSYVRKNYFQTNRNLFAVLSKLKMIDHHKILSYLPKDFITCSTEVGSAPKDLKIMPAIQIQKRRKYKNANINAIPKRIPVRSLRILPLSQRVSLCRNPSKIRGIIITKTISNWGQPQRTAMGIPAIMPINSPVQRAQIGNCFPLK